MDEPNGLIVNPEKTSEVNFQSCCLEILSVSVRKEALLTFETPTSNAVFLYEKKKK